MVSLLVFLSGLAARAAGAGFLYVCFWAVSGLKGGWRRISLLVYDVFPWSVNASWFSYARKKWLLRVFFC